MAEESGMDAERLTSQMTHEDMLHRMKTTESVWLPREVFESLYLNPERRVAGDLRKKFGNPTPAALIGFCVASTPYACQAMGWRGAGGSGGALICVLVFFGGMLQIIAAVGEWIIGNTFSMCIFFTYGTYWIVTGCQLIPWFAVGAQYSDPVGQTFQGMQTSSYHATFAFYYLSLTILTTMFAICALRTNIVFCSSLFLLIFSFGCGAGAFWNMAEGNDYSAGRLNIATGAFTFVLTLLIWYLLFVQLLDAVDFPITLPTGDLSRRIRSKTDRLRDKQAFGKSS